MFGKSLSSFAPSSMIYVSRCAGVVVEQLNGNNNSGFLLLDSTRWKHALFPGRISLLGWSKCSGDGAHVSVYDYNSFIEHGT